MSEQAKRFRQRRLLRAAHTRTRFTYTIALVACVRASRIHHLFEVGVLGSAFVVRHTNERTTEWKPNGGRRKKKHTTTPMYCCACKSGCMCACNIVDFRHYPYQLKEKYGECVNATSSPLSQAVRTRQPTLLYLSRSSSSRSDQILYYTSGIHITIITITIIIIDRKQPATRYIPFNEKISIGTRARSQQHTGNQ